MTGLWLPLALFLLLLPIGWLFPRGTRLAAYERFTLPRGATLFVLILDPVRAGLGAWCLLQDTNALVQTIGRGALGEAILLGGVLAVGLVLQTFSRMDEDFVYAPFAYLAGALLFFCGPAIAAPAILLGIGSSMAMRAWTPYFLGTGVVIGVLGTAVHPGQLSVFAMMGLACITPALAAILSGRHMGFLRR